MSRFTRRRQNYATHQSAGAMNFNPFVSPAGPESFESSEQRINAIIANVQTTREDLNKELVVYEQKMTALEQEFTQYQKLAMKVMGALEVIEGMTGKLTGANVPSAAPAEANNSQPQV